MSPIITVTFIIMFIVCTIESYPTVLISSQFERHPLQIPYSQTSATTYRLSIPDASSSGYVASENRRKRRQISSSSASFGDDSVDDTLARLDLICNKLKKRSTSSSSRNSGGRRSRDTEQLLSFLCKSMIIDDTDLI